WRQAAEARKKGETLLIGGSNLLYSRDVENPSRLSEKDKGKRIEYFMLVRDPEKGKEIKGDDLTYAGLGQDERNQPGVRFKFNNKGSQLFYELTSKNKPSQTHRQLAIILDSQIMSAPSIRQPIRGEGIISGKFTTNEVLRYVDILRSGALPATLKQLPV